MDPNFDALGPEMKNALSALGPMLQGDGPDPALVRQVLQLKQAMSAPVPTAEGGSRPAALIGAALPYLAPAHRHRFFTLMKLMELLAYEEEDLLSAAQEGDLLSSLSPLLSPREKLQAELIARALRLRQG